MATRLEIETKLRINNLLENIFPHEPYLKGVIRWFLTTMEGEKEAQFVVEEIEHFAQKDALL